MDVQKEPGVALCVRVSTDVREKVIALAKREGYINHSDWLRNLIYQQINRQESKNMLKEQVKDLVTNDPDIKNLLRRE